MLLLREEIQAARADPVAAASLDKIEVVDNQYNHYITTEAQQLLVLCKAEASWKPRQQA